MPFYFTVLRAWRQFSFLWVQIHLHSQNNIPAVGELGFSVAPGFHALATVDFSQVSIIAQHCTACMTTNALFRIFPLLYIADDKTRQYSESKSQTRSSLFRCINSVFSPVRSHLSQLLQLVFATIVWNTDLEFCRAFNWNFAKRSLSDQPLYWDLSKHNFGSMWTALWFLCDDCQSRSVVSTMWG